MYQTIGETIAVAGVYQNGKFKLKKFQWRGGTFSVDSSCSVHDFKDGAVRKRRFSVMSKGNVYLLEFNRETETWKLEQVWVEN